MPQTGFFGPDEFEAEHMLHLVGLQQRQQEFLSHRDVDMGSQKFIVGVIRFVTVLHWITKTVQRMFFYYL